MYLAAASILEHYSVKLLLLLLSQVVHFLYYLLQLSGIVKCLRHRVICCVAGLTVRAVYLHYLSEDGVGETNEHRELGHRSCANFYVSVIESAG